jgi:hypothetical protein
MTRNARLSTANFDMLSPMFTPPTPTSELPIIVSSTARNTSLFLRGDGTYVLPLLTPPNTYGAPSSPATLPSHPTLTPGSLFSHISTLYDIPRQPQIQVTSPPSSCFLFSDSDIKEVVWVMSSSKANNEEGFQAKFFKHSLRALVSHLVDLFNHVVHTSFPSAWSHHIIHPIHKSGPSSDPNNYRMIMVGHTFSKLYATVLHMKLSSELEQDPSELGDKRIPTCSSNH